jgi:hypothetical protein
MDEMKEAYSKPFLLSEPTADIQIPTVLPTDTKSRADYESSPN